MDPHPVNNGQTVSYRGFLSLSLENVFGTSPGSFGGKDGS